MPKNTGKCSGDMERIGTEMGEKIAQLQELGRKIQKISLAEKVG